MAPGASNGNVPVTSRAAWRRLRPTIAFSSYSVAISTKLQSSHRYSPTTLIVPTYHTIARASKLALLSAAALPDPVSLFPLSLLLSQRQPILIEYQLTDSCDAAVGRSTPFDRPLFDYCNAMTPTSVNQPCNCTAVFYLIVDDKDIVECASQVSETGCGNIAILIIQMHINWR